MIRQQREVSSHQVSVEFTYSKDKCKAFFFYLAALALCVVQASAGMTYGFFCAIRKPMCDYGSNAVVRRVRCYNDFQVWIIMGEKEWRGDDVFGSLEGFLLIMRPSEFRIFLSRVSNGARRVCISLTNAA